MKEKILLTLAAAVALSLAVYYVADLTYTSFGRDEEALTPSERSFVVYGDTRTRLEKHRKIVELIRSLRPDFIINTGDLVERGADPKDWSQFSRIIEPLEAEYLPAVGNHEQWNGGGKENFREAFPQVPQSGYYSRRRWGIHFIFLNQYLPYSQGSSQHDWLQGELEKTGPTIVVMHEPHFRANHSANLKTARVLVPLLKKHDVDAVFYGHSHMFGLKREEGITYVVTGGGGAPLYEPNPHTLDVYHKKNHFIYFQRREEGLLGQVIGIDGNVLHQFSVDLAAEPIPLPNY